MKRLFLLAALAAACDKKEEKPAPAADGPAKVKVRHILIGWSGAPRSQSTRSFAEAEKKAKDLLERAKNGDDFEHMMKKESEDPGGGTYTMVNRGQTAAPGEQTRDGMVKGFGDAAFRMKVGEIVLVPYDPQSSPFGWHIISRLE